MAGQNRLGSTVREREPAPPSVTEETETRRRDPLRRRFHFRLRSPFSFQWHCS